MAETKIVYLAQCGRGHSPNVYAIYDPRRRVDVYAVQCPTCGEFGGTNVDTVEQAVDGWNAVRGGQLEMHTLAVR